MEVIPSVLLKKGVKVFLWLFIDSIPFIVGSLLDAETFTFEALTLWLRFIPLIKGTSRLKFAKRQKTDEANGLPNSSSVGPCVNPSRVMIRRYFHSQLLCILRYWCQGYQQPMTSDIMKDVGKRQVPHLRYRECLLE